MDSGEIIAKCLAAGKEAADMVRARFGQRHNVSHKGATDLVTEVDVAVEARLRESLGSIFPDAVFVGEESQRDGWNIPASGYCWVVDPVDGTTNFAHDIPLTAISIALCRDGLPVLGIVEAPMLKETYHASRGGGAFLNGAPIEVSKAASLVDCLVCTGFPYEFGANLEGIIARLRAVLPASQGLRRLGAAALDLAWLACGRLDIFYEDGLKPWDMAAGWLLVEEAGGRLSDFYGAPLRFGGSLLASNGHAHEAMTRLLRQSAQ